jgi:ATP-dependent helicase HrpB
VLRSIGLIDHSGAPTGIGRRAATLGVAPRFATALLLAGGNGQAPETLYATALATAMLSERMPTGSEGDLRIALERLASPGAARGDAWAARILEEAGRLVSRVKNFHEGQSSRPEGQSSRPEGQSCFNSPAALAGIEDVGDVLAPGFPDRLARRLDDGTWEFASGRRARAQSMPPRAQWLVALDVDAGDPMGRIRQWAPVSSKAAALALSKGAATSLEVEWRGLAAAARERTRSGVFVLRERRLDAVPAAGLGRAFGERLRAQGLSWLPWDDDSRSLVDRVRYLAAHASGDIEAWSDGVLLERIADAAPDWLSPSGPVIDGRRLFALLESLFDRRDLERLSAEVPAFVTTPGGRRRRPLWPVDGNARLSARIQEFFGMAAGPVACGQPMTLELLSPADRPIQTTSDLAGFWVRTYPSIRAELARRYPRHYWPVDPVVAEPTKGQKPHGKPPASKR